MKRMGQQAYKWVLLTFVLSLFVAWWSEGRAEPPSLERIQTEWQRFTREPHPMGSKAQLEYAKHLRAQLSASGLAAREIPFTVKAPHPALVEQVDGVAKPSAGAPQKQTKAAKVLAKTADIKGVNVEGTLKGTEPCVVLLGGHYDTKLFLNERFVGANDGGSSTVFLLELARLLAQERLTQGSEKKGLKIAKTPKQRTPNQGAYEACELRFVFFDGEEAFFKEWDDGERLAGVKDNLYGSRNYVETQLETLKNGKQGIEGKPLVLLALFDMIGHKNQRIFLTHGSHAGASAQLLALKGKGGGVDLSAVPLGIEDDHIPFARRGVPFVHLIDWTNLAEWHTPKDTLDIVSAEKVAALIHVTQAFLKEKRAVP